MLKGDPVHRTITVHAAPHAPAYATLPPCHTGGAPLLVPARVPKSEHAAWVAKYRAAPVRRPAGPFVSFVSLLLPSC